MEQDSSAYRDTHHQKSLNLYATVAIQRNLQLNLIMPVVIKTVRIIRNIFLI